MTKKYTCNKKKLIITQRWSFFCRKQSDCKFKNNRMQKNLSIWPSLPLVINSNTFTEKKRYISAFNYRSKTYLAVLIFITTRNTIILNTEGLPVFHRSSHHREHRMSSREIEWRLRSLCFCNHVCIHCQFSGVLSLVCFYVVLLHHIMK